MASEIQKTLQNLRGASQGDVPQENTFSNNSIIGHTFSQLGQFQDPISAYRQQQQSLQEQQQEARDQSPGAQAEEFFEGIPILGNAYDFVTDIAEPTVGALIEGTAGLAGDILGVTPFVGDYLEETVSDIGTGARRFTGSPFQTFGDFLETNTKPAQAIVVDTGIGLNLAFGNDDVARRIQEGAEIKGTTAFDDDLSFDVGEGAMNLFLTALDASTAGAFTRGAGNIVGQGLFGRTGRAITKPMLLADDVVNFSSGALANVLTRGTSTLFKPVAGAVSKATGGTFSQGFKRGLFSGEGRLASGLANVLATVSNNPVGRKVFNTASKLKGTVDDAAQAGVRTERDVLFRTFRDALQDTSKAIPFIGGVYAASSVSPESGNIINEILLRGNVNKITNVFGESLSHSLNRKVSDVARELLNQNINPRTRQGLENIITETASYAPPAIEGVTTGDFSNLSAQLTPEGFIENFIIYGNAPDSVKQRIRQNTNESKKDGSVYNSAVAEETARQQLEELGIDYDTARARASELRNRVFQDPLFSGRLAVENTNEVDPSKVYAYLANLELDAQGRITPSSVMKELSENNMEVVRPLANGDVGGAKSVLEQRGIEPSMELDVTLKEMANTLGARSGTYLLKPFAQKATEQYLSLKDVSEIKKLFEPILGTNNIDLVQFVDTIDNAPSGTLGRLKNGLVEISRFQGVKEAKQTLAHEAFHFAFSTLPENTRNKILRDVVDKVGVDYLNEVYKNYRNTEIDNPLVKAEEWLANTIQAKDIPSSLTDRLKLVVAQLKNLVKRLVGRFDTVEDVKNRILLGKYADIKPDTSIVKYRKWQSGIEDDGEFLDQIDLSEYTDILRESDEVVARAEKEIASAEKKSKAEEQKLLAEANKEIKESVRKTKKSKKKEVKAVRRLLDTNIVQRLIDADNYGEKLIEDVTRGIDTLKGADTLDSIRRELDNNNSEIHKNIEEVAKAENVDPIDVYEALMDMTGYGDSTYNMSEAAKISKDDYDIQQAYEEQITNIIETEVFKEIQPKETKKVPEKRKSKKTNQVAEASTQERFKPPDQMESPTDVQSDDTVQAQAPEQTSRRLETREVLARLAPDILLNRGLSQNVFETFKDFKALTGDVLAQKNLQTKYSALVKYVRDISKRDDLANPKSSINRLHRFFITQAKSSASKQNIDTFTQQYLGGTFVKSGTEWEFVGFNELARDIQYALPFQATHKARGPKKWLNDLATNMGRVLGFVDLSNLFFKKGSGLRRIASRIIRYVQGVEQSFDEFRATELYQNLQNAIYNDPDTVVDVNGNIVTSTLNANTIHFLNMEAVASSRDDSGYARRLVQEFLQEVDSGKQFKPADYERIVFDALSYPQSFVNGLSNFTTKFQEENWNFNNQKWITPTQETFNQIKKEVDDTVSSLLSRFRKDVNNEKVDSTKVAEYLAEVEQLSQRILVARKYGENEAGLSGQALEAKWKALEDHTYNVHMPASRESFEMYYRLKGYDPEDIPENKYYGQLYFPRIGVRESRAGESAGVQSEADEIFLNETQNGIAVAKEQRLPPSRLKAGKNLIKHTEVYTDPISNRFIDHMLGSYYTDLADITIYNFLGRLFGPSGMTEKIQKLYQDEYNVDFRRSNLGGASRVFGQWMQQVQTPPGGIETTLSRTIRSIQRGLTRTLPYQLWIAQKQSIINAFKSSFNPDLNLTLPERLYASVLGSATGFRSFGKTKYGDSYIKSGDVADETVQAIQEALDTRQTRGGSIQQVVNTATLNRKLKAKNLTGGYGMIPLKKASKKFFISIDKLNAWVLGSANDRINRATANQANYVISKLAKKETKTLDREEKYLLANLFFTHVNGERNPSLRAPLLNRSSFLSLNPFITTTITTMGLGARTGLPYAMKVIGDIATPNKDKFQKQLVEANSEYIKTELEFGRDLEDVRSGLMNVGMITVGTAAMYLMYELLKSTMQGRINPLSAEFQEDPVRSIMTAIRPDAMEYIGYATGVPLQLIYNPASGAQTIADATKSISGIFNVNTGNIETQVSKAFKEIANITGYGLANRAVQMGITLANGGEQNPEISMEDLLASSEYGKIPKDEDGNYNPFYAFMYGLTGINYTYSPRQTSSLMDLINPLATEEEKQRAREGLGNQGLRAGNTPSGLSLPTIKDIQSGSSVVTPPRRRKSDYKIRYTKPKRSSGSSRKRRTYKLRKIELPK